VKTLTGASCLFAFLVLFAPLSTVRAQAGGVSSTPPRGGRRIVVSSTRVTQAKVDGIAYDIFPETQNLDNPNAPSVWRFDVEPMFVPARGVSTNKTDTPPIDIQQTEYSARKVTVQGGYRIDVHTRLIIPLVIKSDAEMDSAVEALNALYVAQGYKFTGNQISTIPLTQVALKFNDGELDPCTLLTQTIQLSGSESSVPVFFDCLDHPKTLENYQPSELKSVITFRKHLPIMIAAIDVTYDAKEAEPASMNVQSQDVRSSDFFNQLAGKGDTVYVSRDDLRKLSIQASHQLAIRFQGRRMTADEMATCVTPLMASFPETVLDLNQVSAETLQHTYNANDLNPNKINKEMSDTIDKSSSKDEVKFKTDASGDVLFGLAKGSGSLSGSGFQERMAEHGVKTEWDGEKWVAKALDLKQVNVTQLAQTINRSCVFNTYGSEAERTHLVRPLLFK
jgi:hypothetical protein